MNTNSLLSLGTAALVALAAAHATEPQPGAAPRVGIYDSRVLSFAHFWWPPQRQQRDELIANAKAANAAGDTMRFEELQKQIVAGSNQSHLQVFSTAPAGEAMAALKDKLPAIQQELGVAQFVSKWDEAALKGVPETNRVDATDRLVREFSPDEKRQKTIEQMKKSKPLPLDETTRLMREEKL
jgi:hypothetical protein